MKIIILVTLFVLVKSSHQQQQQAAAAASPDQTYNFRYSTGNDGPAQIWREERREADGTIVGKYGYIDPNGEERVVEYRADGPESFSATGAIGPDNAALRFNQAQLNSASRDSARAMNDWNKAAGRSAAIQAAQPKAPVSRQQAAPSWSPATQRDINAQRQQQQQLQQLQLQQQQQIQLQRQQQQQQAAPAAPSAAIPANWPPQVPTWENLPQQQQPIAQQPQNAWPNSANTAQWNSAWQNFNWNENNRRVMADWNSPAGQPVQSVQPAAAPIANQPQVNWNIQPQAPQAAPAAPSSPIVTGPNGAWNMFTEINHADGGLRRAPQISPATAFRNQQVQQIQQSPAPAVPQVPALPAAPAWATGNGFARRSGSNRSNNQQRSQVRSSPPAPTVVSQDPFSFSFGVEHSN